MPSNGLRGMMMPQRRGPARLLRRGAPGWKTPGSCLAGGPTIITAVFGIISSVIDDGLDPVAAVNAPRFHMQHLPDVVGYEEGGMTPALQEALTAMGYTFRERGHLADAPAIGRVGKGWVGAAGPRRVGSLAGGR